MAVVVMLLIPANARADFIAVQWGNNAELLRISERTGEVIERVPTSRSRLNSLARHPSGEIHTITTFAAASGEPLFGIAAGIAALEVVEDINGQSAEFSLHRSLQSSEGQPLRSFDSRGMAYDGTGKLYVMTNGIESNILVSIDSVTGRLTGIGETGNVQSLTFSSDGILYAYDVLQGLGTVNLATGVFTDINSEISDNLPPPSIQTLAFGSDGRLYGAGNGLYSIDLDTGAVNPIGGGPYDIRGMVSVVPEPATFILAILVLPKLLHQRKRPIRL